MQYMIYQKSQDGKMWNRMQDGAGGSYLCIYIYLFIYIHSYLYIYLFRDICIFIYVYIFVHKMNRHFNWRDGKTNAIINRWFSLAADYQNFGNLNDSKTINERLSSKWNYYLKMKLGPTDSLYIMLGYVGGKRERGGGGNWIIKKNLQPLKL